MTSPMLSARRSPSPTRSSSPPTGGGSCRPSRPAPRVPTPSDTTGLDNVLAGMRTSDISFSTDYTVQTDHGDETRQSPQTYEGGWFGMDVTKQAASCRPPGPTGGECPRQPAHGWAKDGASVDGEGDLVDVAPPPVLSRLVRLDERDGGRRGSGRWRGGWASCRSSRRGRTTCRCAGAPTGRRCRQSSQPSPLGVTSATWSR